MMDNSKNTGLSQDMPFSSQEIPVSTDDLSMPDQLDQFGHFDESAYRQAHEISSDSNTIKLPLLGKKTAYAHARTLMMALAGVCAILLVLISYVIYASSSLNSQLAEYNTIKFYAAQLTKNVAAARTGNPNAVLQIKEGHKQIHSSLKELQSNNSIFKTTRNQQLQETVNRLYKNIDRDVEKDIKTIAEQQATMLKVANAATLIPYDLVLVREHIASLKKLLLQRSAPSSQIIAAAQLDVLAERIERLSNEFYSPAGISSNSAALLDADLKSFAAINKALLQGSSSIGTAIAASGADFAVAALQGAERTSAEQLLLVFTPLQEKAELLPQKFETILATRQAKHRILNDIASSDNDINALHQSILDGRSNFWIFYLGIAFFVTIAIMCSAAWAYVQLSESKRLRQWAESQNHNSQAGILRLMDELRYIAGGDLTRQATVTTDITGSIADSVNVTVEDLRSLIGNVQNTSDKVTATTADVELVSSALLEAASEQLNEILTTGQSVVDTAGRINMVSAQAQESVAVARHSRQIAEQGFKAVQDSIAGMNLIRDQIQETSKRIKQLGESSQEIGEITELISDITDQTNVLALNAAIQAASAGEAGRGFSVVAEEVQRLAERSAEAAQQITALVKNIQANTQDAIAAMERSTQGVVQGAQLSDNAGQKLGEIDRVSRQLADLIQTISAAANKEAQSANVVADNIQRIFTATEQTTEGIRVTSRQVLALAKEAQELRTSVARFKIE